MLNDLFGIQSRGGCSCAGPYGHRLLGIDIETSHAEQERIEATLQKIQSSPALREKEFTEWTDDEKIVWPFTGEYWRDELGYYRVKIANKCQRNAPEGAPAQEGGAPAEGGGATGGGAGEGAAPAVP